MKRVYLAFIAVFCFGAVAWFIPTMGGAAPDTAPSTQSPGTGAAPTAPSGEQKTRPLPVVTAQAKNIPMALSYEGTGSIEPSQTATLASPAEGPVLSLSVREGDLVNKGDTLLKIGRTKSAEALLSSALEDLKKEEDEVRRVSLLVQNGAIAGDQLAVARANLQKARAQSAKIKESIEDFNLKAPWPGVISKVLVTEGNFLAPRTPLIEMYAPESLVLRFAVPENISALVKAGMPVEFQLDAHANTPIGGTVSRVYPELDRKTRTLTVEATTPEQLALLPGMFARLKLTIHENSNAVAVPLQALTRSPKGEKIVFTVQEGKAKANKVRTGIETREHIEILEGIAAGDQVIVQGNDKLKTGVAVAVPGGKPEGAPPGAGKGQKQ